MIKTYFIKAQNTIIDVAKKSWKGAATGLILGMLFYLTIMGTYIKTESPIVDILFVLISTCLLLIGVSYISKQLFKLIRNFNPLFVGIFMATFVMASFLPNKEFGPSFILFEMICGALAGFAIVHGLKKPVSIILLVVVIAANAFVFYFLLDEGTDTAVDVTGQYWNQKTNALPFEDPSQGGSYEVKALTYGSGTDKQRPEYGQEADIQTDPVDATPFFNQVSGFGNYMRKLYWGFTAKNYPVNGRVWYPDGEGPFPLVLIVHGNHSMHEYSDPGYEYLGELMAGRGYIFVSVDENFLNGGWFGDYNQSEMFTRAWLLLKHLQAWREWNKTAENVFYQKVDIDNIVLMGHSRGGPAVATAVEINKLKRYYADAKQEFDFGFGIKGIVQLAPNDPYKPQNDELIKPQDINYLTLQGGFDQDMYWFLGNRVYNRIEYTDSTDHFKSALYIYRANHGQFNTVWGRKDFGIPLLWLLNTKPIMKGEEQRKIAKIYISAFLDATLKNSKEFIPLFKDYRYATSILPKDYYINQYEDTKFIYIADYQEDLKVNTATLRGCEIEARNLKTWSENSLPFRDKNKSPQLNTGVYLGWDKNDTTLTGPAEYIIHISNNSQKELQIDSTKNLFFFVCNNKNDLDTVDFTIELSDAKTRVKTTLRHEFILPPPLKTKLTKSDFIYAMAEGKPVERVLQYVEIPFREFTKINKDFYPPELETIRFVFDQTNKGEIFLDKIGIN